MRPPLTDYDAAGNVTRYEDPEHNVTSLLPRRVQPDADRDHRVWRPHQIYDGAGNLTSRLDRNNRRLTQFEYNGLNQRTVEIWKSGAATVMRIRLCPTTSRDRPLSRTTA